MADFGQIDSKFEYVIIAKIYNKSNTDIVISSYLGAAIALCMYNVHIFLDEDFKYYEPAQEPKCAAIINELIYLDFNNKQDVINFIFDKIIPNFKFKLRKFNEDVRPYYEAMPKCLVKDEDSLFEELKCLINSFLVKDILK